MRTHLLPSLFTARSAPRPSRSSAPLTLLPGAMLRLRRVHGLHVRVQAGRIWLTHSGSADDHLLATGQWLTLSGTVCEVLIESDSLQPARLQLCAGPASG